ncbi:hypothetical protein EI94DRAFT_1609819 [Lactarius quietus]|nr:hypothetical protein EI94DRAFT_1609819 [Lactarius quietus]
MPCECIFSSSSETDMKKRNHISPILMEALQRLKFYLKKEHLNFMLSWTSSDKEMATEDPETDLLGELLRDSADRTQIKELVMKCIDKQEE